MSEHLAWVRWWAYPWKNSHRDWQRQDEPRGIDVLDAIRASTLDIPPCLPPEPQHSQLRLVLASAGQLELMLALIRGTFSPGGATQLTEDHQQWCARLSKALSPEMLLPQSDPLQLLRAWVDPATWERLRLRFPRSRVLEMEHNTGPLPMLNGRLNTLWQAVIWRATTTGTGTAHALSTQD